MLKELLTKPTDQLGRWTRFAVFQLRLWRHCWGLLKQNRSGTQAAALAYHTIFGIVPLAIVMLMVFQSFPAYQETGQNVRQFLYKHAQLDTIEYPVEPEEGSQEEAKTVKLTDQIDHLVMRFMQRSDTGAITFVSGIFVIWAAIGLLSTIERSFNQIWHTPQNRSFVHRIANYWSLLTLGPLLLGLAFYASTHYLTETSIQDGLFRYIRPILPYLISTFMLAFFYFVIPNTRVSIRAAIWGAAVAALIWTVAKILFTAYIIQFIPYKALYGVMGLVMLAVMWIFITWLIVLFGLQLTYTTQHLKTLDAAELSKMKKADEHFVANDTTFIRIMAYIFDQFRNRQGPVRASEIAAFFDMPPDFTEKVLIHLVTTGLLFQTAEPDIGYAPATEGGNVRLSDIHAALAKAAFAQEKRASDLLKNIEAGQTDYLNQYTLQDVVTPLVQTESVCQNDSKSDSPV
ncbi:MAG: YihY family inner membrane protein [Sedimentisphaerales bacterium]|nr:YihY family inner membrane protein [Sedimentisphaerales bacterium]